MTTHQNIILRQVAKTALKHEQGMQSAICELIAEGKHSSVRKFLLSAVRVFYLDKQLSFPDAASCVTGMEQAFDCKIDFTRLTASM